MLPLSDASEAHSRLEAGETTGKLVLEHRPRSIGDVRQRGGMPGETSPVPIPKMPIPNRYAARALTSVNSTLHIVRCTLRPIAAKRLGARSILPRAVFLQRGDSVVATVRTCSPQESVSRDVGVRPVLREYLEQHELADSDATLIEELGHCQGRVRIDLATVSGVLHGYEIKSNRDRLSRLSSQAAIYSRVLDRVTLVVGSKHIEAALRLVPRWWGVLLVRVGSNGVWLDPRRPAAENPDQDPRALVELLWRDEALALLACHNAAAGVLRAETDRMGSRVRGSRSAADPGSGPIQAQGSDSDLNVRVTSVM